ncbi:MAG TPA: hypothetical protein VFB81_14345, partial [Myxococcales bacterium]|nr:hypothetical protein [Myxococcales bacterium]
MQTEPPSPQLTTVLPGHESAHPPDQQEAPDWQENVAEPAAQVTLHVPALQVTVPPPPTASVQTELEQVTDDEAPAVRTQVAELQLAVLPLPKEPEQLPLEQASVPPSPPRKVQLELLQLTSQPSTHVWAQVALLEQLRSQGPVQNWAQVPELLHEQVGVDASSEHEQEPPSHSTGGGVGPHWQAAMVPATMPAIATFHSCMSSLPPGPHRR